MKTIGITGNIGCGKSTAARVCGEMGAATIDLDKVAHQLYADDQDLREILVNAFGQEILDYTGQIDRPSLSRIVFSDQDKLRTLNLLVHPRIMEEVRTRLEIYRLMKKEATIVHGALLLDVCDRSFLDQIWVICSQLENVLSRLLPQGMEKEEILRRRSMQSDQVMLAQQADIVLENDIPLSAFEDLVQETYEWQVLVPIYGLKNHRTSLREDNV